MRTVLAVLTLLLATAATAAGETYAVMSLVGDGLLVVRHRATTGTSLEGNLREFLTITEPVFDRAALLAVDTAVRRADPSAHVVLLGGRDPVLLEAQSRALGRDAAAQAIVDALRPRLPATGATRLILVAKSRHPAQIQVPQLSDSRVGSGNLEGLGYYIDPSLVAVSRGASTIADTNAGFLAPFAYFTVALVDLKTGKVLGERPVYAATAISESESSSLSPWDALTPERKVSIVEDLVRREVAQAVPALLATR
jgi:hypothetical protein